jgi:hypothetical protein
VIPRRYKGNEENAVRPQVDREEGLHEASAPCNEPNDVIEVGVVVHTPNPRRIRGARIGHRRQPPDEGHEQER